MIWLAIYVLMGVVVAMECRHAIPDARLTNVIIAGVLWPLTLYAWLSTVVRDWHEEWKKGGKHW